MNGNGGGGEESSRMIMEGGRERWVYMWGYLPGALPERSPLLSPVVVRLPPSLAVGTAWKDVCGGGCGFAVAISGHLIFFCFIITQFLVLLLNLLFEKVVLCVCACFFFLEDFGELLLLK